MDLPSKLQLTVPRETWLKAYADMGGGAVSLLEVWTPGPPADQVLWAECIRRSNLAQSALARGEVEAAMQGSRIVVEGIVAVLAASWNVAKRNPFDSWASEVAGRMSAAWPDDADSAEMLGSLLKAAWAWTSPSHHFGSIVPARAEASFAVSLATHLTQFVSQVLKAHPVLVRTGGSETDSEATGQATSPRPAGVASQAATAAS
jgi:hypothetical protein